MIYDRPFFCSWVEQPAGGLVCSKCGGSTDVRSVRRCKADRQPGESNVALRTEAECLLCAHNRGVREVRSVDCCGGKKTSHKIFGCGVHGKCQLGEVVPGIQVCRKCEAFQPNETGQPANTRLRHVGLSRRG